MPTLCGPDKLQKKSIARSVPKAEGRRSGVSFCLLFRQGKSKAGRRQSGRTAFYRSIHGNRRSCKYCRGFPSGMRSYKELGKDTVGAHSGKA